jgi:aspartyl-tRNA(Asn)/glutamyl-tRNA(Gln) amidotransferase subunit C
MQLSSRDIDHLAKLARLELTPAERDKFSTQLSHILEYVDKIQSVDTTTVLAESVIGPLEKFSEDKVITENLEADLISQVPATEGGAVKTPPIL